MKADRLNAPSRGVARHHPHRDSGMVSVGAGRAVGRKGVARHIRIGYETSRGRRVTECSRARLRAPGIHTIDASVDYSRDATRRVTAERSRWHDARDTGRIREHQRARRSESFRMNDKGVRAEPQNRTPVAENRSERRAPALPPISRRLSTRRGLHRTVLSDGEPPPSRAHRGDAPHAAGRHENLRGVRGRARIVRGTVRAGETCTSSYRAIREVGVRDLGTHGTRAGRQGMWSANLRVVR